MTDEPLHPRDRFEAPGDEGPDRAFVEAWSRGRLHHAWLLCGPQGLGKAAFAHRAARRLLGARAEPSRGPLGAAPDDPVSRLISARSHPDLLVIERLVEGGKSKKQIAVEQVRALPEFFGMSPAQAPWRVAIIDAADDLNPNAANALLKVLEEPPQRGLLFLVSHAPGRLLPTIRSRCRRLVFSPWPAAELAQLVERRRGLAADEAARIAAMAGGSPGRALQLSSGEALELDRLAASLLGDDAAPPAERLALADTFRRAEGPERFELLFDRLLAAVRDRALAAGGAEGARWSALWSRLAEAPDRAAGLNLDRAEVFAAAVDEIARLRTA